MATELWSIGLVLLGSIIGAIGALLFKIGSKKFSITIKGFITNHILILGFFFYVLSATVFIVALTGGELSVLYPMVATGYIWVCLLAMFFLGEKMNRWKWFGVIAILIGVTLIGGS